MEKKDVLIKLARGAIAEEFGIDSGIDIDILHKQNPWLDEPGAAFVTLNRKQDGSLRGCIGSIIAHQSLFDDIIQNAKSAAFGDPRFQALSKDEFDKITIEVSILGQPKALNYDSIDDLRSKIRPGIDGVIFRLGTYQATYLPQVWKQLPNFDAFFSTLCQKAGLEPSCLERHPDIYTYQAEEFYE